MITSVYKKILIVILFIIIIMTSILIYNNYNKKSDNISEINKQLKSINETPKIKEEINSGSINIISTGSTDEALNNTWNTDLIKEKIKNSIIINNIWQSWNKEDCDTLKEQVDKYKCLDNYYSFKSNVYNDKYYCEQMINPTFKINCLNKFIFIEVTNKTKRLEDCSKIKWNTELLESCKSKIIFEQVENFSSNKSLCDNLKNIDNKNYCINTIEKNKIKFTDSIELDKASISLNISDCSSISDILLQEYCFESVYYDLAIKNNDESKCELINSTNKKNQCLEYISKEKDELKINSSNNLSSKEQTCESLNTLELKEKCLDDYYLEIAVTNKEKNNCDFIQNQVIKDQCNRVIDTLVK